MKIGSYMIGAKMFVLEDAYINAMNVQFTSPASVVKHCNWGKFSIVSVPAGAKIQVGTISAIIQEGPHLDAVMKEKPFVIRSDRRCWE